MNRQLPLLAVVLTVFAVPAFSQSSRLSDSCDLATLGADNTKGFLAFDRELRAAISKQDAVAVTLLVDHHLRINIQGSYYLEDAASLQSRFQQVFPLAVRNAILQQPVEKLFCNWTGVMYGGTGVVWVSRLEDVGERYLITAINLPDVSLSSGGKATGKIRFICETDRERVVIDTGVDGNPRYRSWSKPRPLTDSPSLIVAAGEERHEGTGTCLHFNWTFKNGTAEFVAQELGCMGGTEPKGARGLLGVSNNDEPSVDTWCF